MTSPSYKAYFIYEAMFCCVLISISERGCDLLYVSYLCIGHKRLLLLLWSFVDPLSMPGCDLFWVLFYLYQVHKKLCFYILSTLLDYLFLIDVNHKRQCFVDILSMWIAIGSDLFSFYLCEDHKRLCFIIVVILWSFICPIGKDRHNSRINSSLWCRYGALRVVLCTKSSIWLDNWRKEN